MNRKILLSALPFTASCLALGLAAWLALGSGSGFAAEGNELEVAPHEGILVLRSGGILRGAITRAGEEYYVGVGGGEIRLKVDDVELACDNLDEAYRLKAAALPTGHVSEHIALAEWCLRQRLLGYAAKELVLAREADPSFPKLNLLERRLDLAQHPVEPHVVSVPPPKPNEADKQADASEIARRIPPRSLELFTNTIQPLLTNGCAAAACHGTASNNRLRLERIALGRPTSYRISQRNLAAVLNCVDLENPANSPLLMLPLSPHGTATEAIFTRRDRDKYRQLVAWVIDVTNNMIPPAPNNVATPAAPLLQNINQSVAGVSTGQPETNPTATDNAPDSSAAEPTKLLSTVPSEESDAEKGLPDNQKLPAKPQPNGTLKESQERRGLQFGAATEAAQPVDPFDPEIFNREFGPRH
jgi:hypothetical protein